MVLIGLLLATARLDFDGLVSKLDALAVAKDAAGLTSYLEHAVPTDSQENPFRVIQTGGGYAVGKFGWHALKLEVPSQNRRFVVFSTALTVEDAGELLFEEQGGKLTYIPEDERFGVRILHHDFDVKFQTKTKTIFLKDGVELESDSAGLKFLRLAPSFRIDSIDGKKAFSQSGGIVALNLAKGKRRLRMTYHSHLDLPTYAGSLSEEELMLADDYWYPMVGRWPSTYDLTMTTPRTWTAVAQGALVGKKRVGNTMRWKYHMRMPVSYFSASAGPYRVTRSRIHGRTYTVWNPHISAKRARLQNELYAGAVEFYSHAFEPWPFKGYGTVISPAYGGGALEAYSYATWGGNDIPGDDPHEAAHTYWGGRIANTYLHSMWNESFAEYSVGLYHRNALIGKPEVRRLAFVTHPNPISEYNSAPVSTASPFIGGPANALGYSKGAEVLAMLEDEIGTARMLKAIRRWLQVHKRGTPGEWEEFEAVVNETTGQDYSWFFKQWLDRPGFPNLSLVDGSYDHGSVHGKFRFDGEPYRMTIEAEVYYGEGRKDLRRLVIPSQAESSFEIPSQQRPIAVVFDPYRRLLRNRQQSEDPSTLSNATQAQKPGRGIPAGRMRRTVNDPDAVKILGNLGVKILGNYAVFKGTRYDLRNHKILVLLGLGYIPPKILEVGHIDVERPIVGDTTLAIVDHLGRLVDGTTTYSVDGPLTIWLSN